MNAQIAKPDYATDLELYHAANTLSPAAAERLRILRRDDGRALRTSGDYELKCAGFVTVDGDEVTFTKAGESAADIIWG